MEQLATNRTNYINKQIEEFEKYSLYGGFRTGLKFIGYNFEKDIYEFTHSYKYNEDTAQKDINSLNLIDYIDTYILSETEMQDR